MIVSNKIFRLVVDPLHGSGPIPSLPGRISPFGPSSSGGPGLGLMIDPSCPFPIGCSPGLFADLLL